MRSSYASTDDFGKSLLGKNVLSVELSDCSTFLRFNLDNDDPVLWFSEADCCSDTWIEHVSIPHRWDWDKSPLRVSKVEYIEMGDVMPTRQDRDQLYGVTVHLEDVDRCSEKLHIEFRNSSNGYYGGYMTAGDRANRALLSQNQSNNKVKFEKLTENV